MLLKVIQREQHDGNEHENPSLFELVRTLTLHGPGPSRTFAIGISSEAATVDVWYPGRGWTPLSHIPNRVRPQRHGRAHVTKESIVGERERLLKIAFEVEYGRALDMSKVEEVDESTSDLED